jgi:hypothetical protein
MPHDKRWGKEHGSKAAATSGLCAKCHITDDCRACHDRVAPRSHDREAWRKGHASEATKQAQLCTFCHGAHACDDCHKVAMPHPSDWMLTHKQRASFKPDSVCYRCHAFAQLCSNCHAEPPKQP